ncbi:MAG: oxidoreductase [Thermodesulfobacteriota bacterium]
MASKPEYGLLIDYEYCTGCQACVLACAQEYGWDPGISGMQVSEIVQNLPRGRHYLTYLPFPTELCVLCRPRTKKGLKPSCVVHCMADVIRWGRLDELSKALGSKSRLVLWSPR